MQSDIFKEIDALQKEIQSHRPLDPETLHQIRNYYKIGLTYSSNALEGNTLTESETKIVLEEGITAGGKPLKDHLEAIGHAEAYDFLYTLVKNKNIEESDIQKIHQLFYFRIDEHNAGKYRKSKAILTGSKYPLPKPEDLNSLMQQLPSRIEELRKEYHPVKAAALAHKEFVFIHPFIDGNGRTARLLMNLILLQDGYNIAIIPPVVRREYIESLEEAHKSDTSFVYTESNSRFGRCQGGAPIFGQAQPAPKQVNSKELADAGGTKSGGCPTQAEPILESRAVYLIARMVRETQKDLLRLFLN